MCFMRRENWRGIEVYEYVGREAGDVDDFLYLASLHTISSQREIILLGRWCPGV